MHHRFNFFRSRKESPSRGKERYGQESDLEYTEDDSLDLRQDIQHQSPSIFHNILPRHRRPQSEEDEPWELLDHPPEHEHPRHRRPTVEDYYSDDESIPSHSTEDTAYVLSESSVRNSPIPVVQRQEDLAHSQSRMFEQFSTTPTPQASIGPGVQLRDPGFVRNAHPEPRTSARPARHRPHREHRQVAEAHEWEMNPGEHHRAQDRHQHQHPDSNAGQRSGSPTFSAGSASVVHVLEDGTRIQVPAEPYNDRGRSITPRHRTVNPHERTYYIIPPGMNVIFRDEHGRELKRVGDFSGTSPPVQYREAPIILKDEAGRVIYETNGTDEASTDVSDDTYQGHRPNVVHLGQYVTPDVWRSRSPSPVTVSLDRREMQTRPDDTRSQRSRRSHRSHRSPSPQTSIRIIYSPDMNASNNAPSAYPASLGHQASVHSFRSVNALHPGMA